MNVTIDKNNTNKNQMVLKYYDKHFLCSEIKVNTASKTIDIKNYTDDNIRRAFGCNENPTWGDFMHFLEERCFPRDRQNIKFELKKLGLTEYDPLKICQATQGRNYKDEQWMEFEDVEME